MNYNVINIQLIINYDVINIQLIINYNNSYRMIISCKLAKNSLFANRRKLY